MQETSLSPKEQFKNKKVLIMGLGVFGGGASSAKWFLKYGADVRVTDLRAEKDLGVSLKMFTKKQAASIDFILGRHRKSDFKWAEIVVVNPAVPRENEYLKLAKSSGALLVNDTSIFFQFMENTIIGVTGTRGKTTTTNWITQLLSRKYGKLSPTGNTPDNPLLAELSKTRQEDTPIVAELSSWQLEFLPSVKKAPHIAIITNISRDHMNRYRSMTQYANAKANIFKYQTEDDFLILNRDNEWTPFLLGKKPKAHVFYISTKRLPKNTDGLYIYRGHLIFHSQGEKFLLCSIDSFVDTWGSHYLENLLATILTLILMDVRISTDDIKKLSGVRLRQEKIYDKKGITIINDSAATSPEAMICAIDLYSSKDNAYFIVGGTDKQLDYSEAAGHIAKKISPSHLILLTGSGTTKLVSELFKLAYFSNSEKQEFDSLEKSIKYASSLLTQPGTLVFTPGGSSFELFKNEFHRGECFNTLIKKYFK